jgi:hypothetical protein
MLDKMFSPEPFDRQTFEHYIFTLVFEIPCPRPGIAGSSYFEGLKMSLPDITELPYVNNSHFDKLLTVFEDEKDIVRVFTSLLFEERVLLIMDSAEDLLPVSYALQSLIYPFELTIFIPYLANDCPDNPQISNLAHVA